MFSEQAMSIEQRSENNLQTVHLSFLSTLSI